MSELTELEGIIKTNPLVEWQSNEYVDGYVRKLAQAVLDALPSLGYAKRDKTKEIMEYDRGYQHGTGNGRDIERERCIGIVEKYMKRTFIARSSEELVREIKWSDI